MWCHILVPPLLYLPILEKWIIELSNLKIYVRHNLSDLLKAPPINYVVEAVGGAFIGVKKDHLKRSPL